MYLVAILSESKVKLKVELDMHICRELIYSKIEIHSKLIKGGLRRKARFLGICINNDFEI